ncbi:RNA polymerase sigma factor [Methylomonas albis]|uniref:RNA polymerase sigma factor n=1 Tax=Methylomonas albis TaxID=1854563 RepID=A0ABR9CY97_9GAMM|nr:RNA polymerase sigma factor [Methylomonas albis]MBD9355828.1 RNA polymerase sigma factor [Methylomonas albis]
MSKTVVLFKPLSWPQSMGRQMQQSRQLQVGVLYDNHYEDLKAFLSANCRDQGVVEVILQDVYLRLMEMDDLSVMQTPAAYLNRLAHNLLIDHFRRRQRETQRFVEETEHAWELADEAPGLHEELHYRQQLDAYDTILAQLPPPAPEIVYLHRVLGLTHTEIARRFGKSKSWVEKSIAKSLLHCRNKLRDFEP